jgi:hypothetical protein
MYINIEYATNNYTVCEYVRNVIIAYYVLRVGNRLIEGTIKILLPISVGVCLSTL